MEAEEKFITEPEEEKRFFLSRTKRILTLVLLYSIILFENSVITTFNMSTSAIQASLHIKDETLRIFKIIYTFGQFISAICTVMVLGQAQRKGTVLFSVFTILGIVLIFQFTTNQMIILPFYFFSSFCIMSMNVFISLWIDQLAIFSYKTMFLSVTNLSRACGTCLSIYLNFIFGPEEFKKSFLVQGFFLALIGIGVTQINSNYFCSNLLTYKGRFGEERFKWKAKTQKDDIDIKSLDGESIYRFRHSGKSNKDKTVFTILFNYAKNKRYVCGVISNVILNTATIGFSKFNMDYINNYFTIEKNDKFGALKNKLMLTIIGPFFALVLIFIISKLVGNYYSRTTPVLMFGFYLFITITGNIIPYLTSYGALSYATIFYNIAASAMGVYLQGTNLSAGTPSLKPYGVTIGTISIILFAVTPAPYVYQTISNRVPKEYILNIYMKMLIMGAVFNFLMMIFRRGEYKPKEEKKPAIELSEK